MAAKTIMFHHKHKTFSVTVVLRCGVLITNLPTLQLYPKTNIWHAFLLTPLSDHPTSDSAAGRRCQVYEDLLDHGRLILSLAVPCPKEGGGGGGGGSGSGVGEDLNKLPVVEDVPRPAPTGPALPVPAPPTVRTAPSQPDAGDSFLPAPPPTRVLLPDEDLLDDLD